jgi:hypothetical protein
VALLALHARACADGAAVIVAIVPPVTWLGEESPRHRETLALCAAHRWRCLDLTPTLRAAGRRAYLDPDPHWSAVGHRVAGTALADALQ